MANPPDSKLSLQDIRDLIERISSSDFTHFEIEMGDAKLKLERRAAAPAVVQAVPAMTAVPAPAAAVPAAAAPASAAPAAENR